MKSPDCSILESRPLKKVCLPVSFRKFQKGNMPETGLLIAITTSEVQSTSILLVPNINKYILQKSDTSIN